MSSFSKDSVLEIQNILDRSRLAAEISEKYLAYQSSRNTWLDQKREARDYVFATDTSTTSNGAQPWRNKTTIPKLCQIRDNLHANYMATLFPGDNWLIWEGYDRTSVMKSKRNAIETYMGFKLRQTDFRRVVSQLVYDFIDYGNAFADVEYVSESKMDEATGETIAGYVGPRLMRISPLDIVFDPTASNFESSSKITRSIVSLGQLVKLQKTRPELGYTEEAIEQVRNVRVQLSGYNEQDIRKAASFEVDGFSNLHQYYTSGSVEILEFEGDFYDIETGELKEDYIITIIDRSQVIRMAPSPTWTGKGTKRHVGWRQRPDNIYAMGPLDNLVGMQYRIDHLENMKADLFDLIAAPPLKIKGEVQEFEWAPYEKIYVGDDGDVTVLAPDSKVLNADFQISTYENKMEELAGAPKTAMGIRTPGEKTAFEVQSLDNAAGRIFQNKTSYFEENFLEPLLNTMLEMGRRNMNSKDIIPLIDQEFGVKEFIEVTKEDLAGSGKIRPIGARHFATKAQLMQNLVQLSSSAIGQDPSVSTHISGFELAKLVEETLGIQKFGLVKKNIRVTENADTQRLVNQAQQDVTSEDLGDEL